MGRLIIITLLSFISIQTLDAGSDWKATSVANNETRNMSHNVSHVKYNLHNLPESVIFANGNVLSFVYMADRRRLGTDRPADKDL